MCWWKMTAARLAGAAARRPPAHDAGFAYYDGHAAISMWCSITGTDTGCQSGDSEPALLLMTATASVTSRLVVVVVSPAPVLLVLVA